MVSALLTELLTTRRDGDGSSGRAQAMWGIAGSEDCDGRLDMGQDPTARRFDMGERSDFSTLGAAATTVRRHLSAGLANPSNAHSRLGHSLGPFDLSA